MDQRKGQAVTFDEITEIGVSDNNYIMPFSFESRSKCYTWFNFSTAAYGDHYKFHMSYI